MPHESIPEFPKLTESDLRIIGLGSYQLFQTEAYYAEHVNEDGKYVFDGYKHLTLFTSSHSRYSSY